MCHGEKIVIPEEANHVIGADIQGDLVILVEEKEHPVIKNMLIESFARRKLTGEDISFVVRRGMKDRVAELLDRVPVNCIDTEDFFGFPPLRP